MSDFACNLPRKFNSFRHLGFEISAHNVPQDLESENPQNVEEVVEMSTAKVGQTPNSPAKLMSVLQNVPRMSEVVVSGEVQKDHELTIAEKDCVMTSSEEGMDDMNAFVKGKLQIMTKKCLDQLVGDESVNVEEILGGNLASVSGHVMGSERTVGLEVGEGRTTSVCPGLTCSANVEESTCAVVTSTPVKGLWPIYSKKRSSVLGGHEARPCKSPRFGIADTVESVEGGNLSRNGMTEASGGVEGSDFTSGGFSTLEAIAKK